MSFENAKNSRFNFPNSQNIPYNTRDTASLKMDKLGKGSEFRRNTLVRSRQPATTSLGQPASAPSASLGSTQPRRPVVAQPAARAWADKQAALQQDQVQQDKIWRESVEAEQRGRKIWVRKKSTSHCQTTCLCSQAKSPTRPTRLLAVESILSLAGLWSLQTTTRKPAGIPEVEPKYARSFGLII
nr:uncharacterized protein C2orf50 homolog isoform X2 [Columba livia]